MKRGALTKPARALVLILERKQIRALFWGFWREIATSALNAQKKTEGKKAVTPSRNKNSLDAGFYCLYYAP